VGVAARLSVPDGPGSVRPISPQKARPTLCHKVYVVNRLNFNNGQASESPIFFKREELQASLETEIPEKLPKDGEKRNVHRFAL
jgi:hypothetical protein